MEETTNIRDFRLTNLVGRIYKLITKVLTRRMPKGTNKAKVECQHSFVGGRQILHTVLVANKVVDNLLDRKKGGVIYKLSVEKVYDHVN